MSKTKRHPDWPFDRETLASPAVQAAIAEWGRSSDDLMITSAIAMALLGRRRPKIGDDEHVSLGRVAKLLGEGDAHRIACGLHSGFPPCCIRFFIEWDSLPAVERRQHQIEMAAVGRRIGYLPCRVCLRAKRFAKVRRCDCEAEADAAIARAAEGAERRLTRGPNKR